MSILVVLAILTALVGVYFGLRFGVLLPVLGGAARAGAWVTRASLLFPFLIFYFFVLLFLSFDPHVIWHGEDATRWHDAVQAYMIALAFVFALSLAKDPFLGLSVGGFFLVASIGVVVGAVIFKVFAALNPEHLELAHATRGQLIGHSIVVAVSEELIFRFLFLTILVLTLGPVAGIVISSMMFAALHVEVYTNGSAAWPPTLPVLALLAYPFVLGVIFSVITLRIPRWGLVFVMGLHTAWNWHVVGGPF